MKSFSPLTTLASLLALNIKYTTAGCFSSGETWPSGDIDSPSYHVERACNGYDGIPGAFQGSYKPGEIKQACVQYSSTSLYIFEVQNLSPTQTLDLYNKNCVLRLQNEIKGCNKGGESSIDGWRFKADPNNGICGR
ncbi:Ff.00g040140.m01.CDS01 [Fusarium sp. VM40]|nr:Ff.00g040140.m01.CDS01 [Fusarium sp. VM40]